jgi:uncharacterized protein (DUF302 family)
MKKTFILIFLFILATSLNAMSLKPYVLAGVEKGDLTSVISKTEKALKKQGFSILGKYSPMKDKNRKVICVTHELIQKSVLKTGGLTAFASAVRIGVYKNGDHIEISYMNPLYWANAYYRKNFPQVEANYQTLIKKIEKSFKNLGIYKNLSYGSKNGVRITKLRTYKYMIGMPKFDKVVVIADNSNFSVMVKRIRKNLAANLGGAVKVYEVSYPEKELTVFGVGLWGQKGEKKFLPKIDFNNPKHITFLPYELLVMKDRVVMLHGRFRIALSFPDLKMGTFMKIVSTPGDIANSMRILTIVK